MNVLEMVVNGIPRTVVLEKQMHSPRAKKHKDYKI